MIAKGTYFEDIEVNNIRETPAITITETHVSLYLGLTREPSIAAAGDVPAVLPLCMSIGLGWRVKEPPLAVLAFVGLDWQIVKEVRVGDTVHGRARVISKRPMRDAGIVIDERSLIDQRGEVVQQGKFTFLVAKRKEVPA